MRVLIALFFAVFLFSFASAPFAGAGWSWDLANGLGFAAFAGMLYLTVPIHGARDVRDHELFAYTIIALVVTHGLWFLVTDEAVAAYMKPGAPVYMWAGVAGLMLLFLVSILAVLPERMQFHARYRVFRRWHRALAALALAGAIWHIVGSGFYVSTWNERAALVLVAVLLTGTRELRLRIQPAAIANSTLLLALTAIGVAVFVLVRNASP